MCVCSCLGRIVEDQMSKRRSVLGSGEILSGHSHLGLKA